MTSEGRRPPVANLMVDKGLIKRICGYADLKKEDVVLEIGAGTGNLTEELRDRCATVYAIEKNMRFCEILERKFGNGNVRLIRGDALRTEFPAFDKSVSNLPYSISRRITEKLLSHPFRLAVLVYQKEYAEKLATPCGSENYRYISALTQSCAGIEILETVPPEAFDPAPEVDSAVVRLTPHRIAERGYMDFLKNLYNHKNKVLARILDDAPPGMERMRPFQLPPDELWRLYQISKDGG